MIRAWKSISAASRGSREALFRWVALRFRYLRQESFFVFYHTRASPAPRCPQVPTASYGLCERLCLGTPVLHDQAVRHEAIAGEVEWMLRCATCYLRPSTLRVRN